MHSLFLTCLSVSFATLLATLSTPSLTFNQVTHTFKSSKNSILSPGRAVSTRQSANRLMIAAAASEVTDRAFSMVGTPYRWGDTILKKGFDCNGLVNCIFQGVDDVDLLRTVRAIHNINSNKISRGKLQPGDLVFFWIRSRSVGHVGIYVGNGCFVHTPRHGEKVRVPDLNSSHWKCYHLADKRILPTTLTQVESTRERRLRHLWPAQIPHRACLLDGRALSRPVNSTTSQIGA